MMTDDIDPALVERCAKAMANAPRRRDGVRHDIKAVLRAAGVPEMIAALEEIRDMQWMWHGGKGYSRNELHQHIDDLKKCAEERLAALKKARGEG